MKKDQDMDPVIALAWAVAAKNGFPMHGGYSSYQLVYGKNPNMPNILYDKLPAMNGVTTSESVAAHISALHKSRIAFTEAMCDQKVRRALRHKVRAVERTYAAGEKVYYRRDSDKAEWRGPAGGNRKSRICTLSSTSGRCCLSGGMSVSNSRRS